MSPGEKKPVVEGLEQDRPHQALYEPANTSLISIDISEVIGSNNKAVSLRSSWTDPRDWKWVCLFLDSPSNVGGNNDIGFAQLMILVFWFLLQVMGRIVGAQRLLTLRIMVYVRGVV